MKVIGGKVKGHKFKTNKSLGVRPTSAKVKEALFNILERRIKGAIFLDLYAGTGSIGIESLSRGAKEAIFVDNNLGNVKIIKENLKKLNFMENSQVYKKDVINILKFLSKKGKKFDIIFLDAPYYKNLAKEVLTDLIVSGIIKDDGVIIVEHYGKEILPKEIDNLIVRKQRGYGDTVLSFYER